jgi:hypothetical protein
MKLCHGRCMGCERCDLTVELTVYFADNLATSFLSVVLIMYGSTVRVKHYDLSREERQQLQL